MRAYFAVLVSLPVAACATMGQRSLAKSPPAVVYMSDSARAVMVARTSEVDTGVPTMSAAGVPDRGARVRVVFPAGRGQPERYLEGRLYRLAPDTVIMARGIQADTVFLGDGRQLQAVVRSRNHGNAGSAVGFFAGAVIGGAMGAASYEPCVPSGGMFDMSCMFAPTQGEMTAGGAILGGLVGGLVGYVVGASMRTEEWGTVPLAGTNVSVAPSGLGVRIAF